MNGTQKMAVMFCLLFSPLLAEDAPQAETQEASTEADRQKLEEEALKLDREVEISKKRAERIKEAATKQLAETAKITEDFLKLDRKLEMVMKGAERTLDAAYKQLAETAKVLAEKANQTKSPLYVLHSKKAANRALELFKTTNERRIRQAWADRGSRPGDGSEALIQKEIDHEYQKEKARIEGFLDESLRGE
jgi:hypothetical protein